MLFRCYLDHDTTSLLLQGSVTAGSLAAAPPQMQQTPGSPSPRVKLMDCMMQQVPNPSSDLPRPHSANQLIRAEAPAPRMVTTPPAAAQIRVEPAAARAATAPAASQPAYTHHSLPEPPTPRSWTPSKLGTSSGAQQALLDYSRHTAAVTHPSQVAAAQS